jgi:pyruvate dehydrogenase E2 component (dihydrolipoamide acetyltransferase)
MSTIEVKVPALGEFEDVPIIDVLVKPGDEVKENDALVTLESEKATMDVPSPAAGKVRDLRVKVGDKVSEGSVVLTLERDGEEGRPAPAPSAPREEPRPPREEARASRPVQAEQSAPEARAPDRPEAEARAPEARAPEAEGEGAGAPVEVRIPALGDFEDVPVIDVLVKPGDEVKENDPLLTLESEKATMDLPAPSAGTVRELKVKVGDRVKEGTLVAILDARARAPRAAPPSAPAREAEPRAPIRPEEPRAAAPEGAAPPPRAAPPPETGAAEGRGPVPHASPSVRKLARELGADLARVEGSGRKGRILQEDVQRYVKGVVSAAATGAGARGFLDLPPWPRVDFAKFGPIETRPLPRIRKIAAANLSRNWVMIPHVTQHDEADITDLEAFRVALNREHEKDGVKVTILAFLVKACVAALRRFPEVNASLDGDQLVLKRHYHIGFAADTPNGLLVPVLRDADRKGVLEIARELAALAARAREGKLSPADMQGGTFSISSLGGIGGTAFTPIINAPEVAILGASRSARKPVWDGERFTPRLVLPLSLSYDHRVVDGALAARFTSFLAQVLADMRRAML